MNPDWSAHHVLIVACGPSAAAVDLEPFRSSKVIAINDGWRLCPWADVLYAADDVFWEAGRGDGFAGQKVRGSDLTIRGDEISFDPAFIGSGGTSTFQALNLAVQWGAKRIGLVGLDCRTDLGEHWHRSLGGPLQQSAVKRWIKSFENAAPVLAAAGIEVINHSGVSALTGFRKEPLPEVRDMRVFFLADYDYSPAADPRVTIAYRAGMELTVKRECGLAAVAAGKARQVKAPRRGGIVTAAYMRGDRGREHFEPAQKGDA